MFRICALHFAVLVLASRPLTAQEVAGRSIVPRTSTSDRGTEPEGGTVELNFGDEIELKGLVDYVSRRLAVNFLYDEQILNKKVTIRAPGKIPISSLMGLLESALRMKDLALADGEVPGWKRIVQGTKLSAVSRAGSAAEMIGESGHASAVTQVFVLQHEDPIQVEQSIRPFLTLPGANSIALRELGVLIVTDYASNVVKIAKLVEQIDSAKADVALQLIPLTHAPALDVSRHITEMLAARHRTGDSAGGAPPMVAVGHDERTNQLVVIGSERQVATVRDFVRALDVPLEETTEVYETKHVSAERLDQMVQELVQPSASKRVFHSAVDTQANLLVVTTTPEFHKQIRRLQERLDVISAKEQSPIRLHRLQHVTAQDLLQTLRAIEEENSSRTSSPRATSGGLSAPGRPGMERSMRDRRSPRLGPDRQYLDNSAAPDGRMRGLRNVAQAGPNRPPSPPGAELPLPPAYTESGLPEETDDSQLRLAPGRARVTADESSNTLIVVGDPAIQQVYAQLIRSLDQRRPQVLIEAKLVVVDTSDDFALGVEVAAGDRIGMRRLFAFTSFGLSTVDPVTGSLAIIPGAGFNGTLVDPEVADAVLRALAKHKRARILSAPRVLVNDNAEGILASVAEVPFTSVNASQTVATTSFAGFAEAGTTIVVRPHIGANDHLQLEFVVTMNNFTGEGTPGIPPSRQTEEVESKITIPDGHTVIVGGLNRKEQLNATEGIPFIEHIPVLRFMAGKEIDGRRCTSLFIFIRPIILRDDKFRDLKFLSDRDVDRASLPGHFPSSEPLLIK